MALFIRRFSMLMASKSSSKGTRKRSLDQRPKGLATIVVSMVIILLIVPTMKNKKEKSYKKDKQYKKKAYGEAHIGKEWDSDDESSDSDSDDVDTIAIKGSSSSSK
jgi:hypothetical protein